jgi:hypothetical protein
MSVTLRVFDPAMCCSTGICGPSVDSELVRFAADLDWLKSQGVQVERFNLSQQPAAFASDAEVKAALEARGEDGLPVVKVGDEVKSSGVYPSRDELAAWAGVKVDAKAEPAPKAKSGGCCGSSAKPEPAPKASSGGCCGSSSSITRSTGNGSCC